ncbi:hypothetical protein ruthe_02380 [Rubellimicrobium thermophilum DSM 16684]|uniref:Uncharacterized protein n=2 Tax=Rubellimicrobium TaxID=295418 RepID=S9S1S7_9RHOB|nr:hypothetical protein ruthe_02380 [Rubellimicrobium thermophilum DSM 16684]
MSRMSRSLPGLIRAVLRGGGPGMLLAVLIGLPALAQQPVRLRGGEHGDFTRLVLPLPDGVDWTFAPAEGGFALRLSMPVSFDLSEVFARIPRSRLTALTEEEGGVLTLAVPCDCHAETFLHRDRWLVIDLHDGPGPEGALRPGQPAEPVPETAGAEDRPDPVSAGAADGAAPPAGPAPALPAAGPNEQTLAEAIARAASLGLLEPVPGLPPPSDPGPVRRPPTAVALPPDPDPDPALLPPALPGLALHDAAQIPDPAAPPALGPTGESCLPPEAFDLAAWAGEEGFAAAIAPRLAAFTDARDRVDPEGAEALARTYVAFGLGREALVALAADGGASAGRDRLRLLARLVDGEAVDPDALEGQAGCLGPVALWRALARQSVAGTSPQERSAILVALRALPTPLRGSLALRLAEIHLAEGEAEDAAALLPLAAGAGAGGRAPPWPRLLSPCRVRIRRMAWPGSRRLPDRMPAFRPRPWPSFCACRPSCAARWPRIC